MPKCMWKESYIRKFLIISSIMYNTSYYHESVWHSAVSGFHQVPSHKSTYEYRQQSSIWLKFSIFGNENQTFRLTNMKISSYALLSALLTSSAVAFVPSTAKFGRSVALSSTATPPERVAPDAGYIPDWEDRPGLAPEEFMQSDMSKPDLAGMWECPLTRWDSEG